MSIKIEEITFSDFDERENHVFSGEGLSVGESISLSYDGGRLSATDSNGKSLFDAETIYVSNDFQVDILFDEGVTPIKAEIHDFIDRHNENVEINKARNKSNMLSISYDGGRFDVSNAVDTLFETSVSSDFSADIFFE